MIMRVGLMVPSSNTVAEPDFYRGLPSDATLHTSRMLLESTTAAAEEAMLDHHTLPAAELLAGVRPDIVVFACTSAGALRGDAYDSELCDRISAITGAPTVSVIKSVRSLLSEAGAKTVAVLTPYVDELNQRIKASLEDDGYEVAAIHGMGLTANADICQVEPAQLVEFARQRLGERVPAQALFVSCTNLRAVAARPLLQGMYDVPVITSNHAAIEAVRRAASNVAMA